MSMQGTCFAILPAMFSGDKGALVLANEALYVGFDQNLAKPKQMCSSILLNISHYLMIKRSA